MRHARGEQGATIIESVVAAALFAMTAAAVYPLFSDTKKISKQGDVRKLCQEVVRSKLDEYRFGKSTNPTWAASPAPGSAAPEYAGETLSSAAKPQLTNLTISSRSASSVSNGQTLATSGFMYAKVRYNRYFPDICDGTSQALRAPAQVLGIRECVGSSYAWIDTASPTSPYQTLSPKCSANTADLRVSGEIPGFKLYVKLERTSPWQLPDLAAPKLNQFHPTCPNFGRWRQDGSVDDASTASFYDFDANGDGIRVTVTGVMDTISASADPSMRNFAGIPDGRSDAWVCSAQTTLYPETYPVRYYLSVDGRIYPVQGGGINGGTSASSWILSTVYSQSAAFRSSGIISFAVHPLNASVYVLKPGVLTRYGNCGGSVLDCSNSSTAMNGVSDTGEPGWPDVQEFTIEPSIRYIGVDFRSGRIYGMKGDRNTVVAIGIDCLASDPACGRSTAPVITQTEVPAGTFPVPPSTVAGQSGISRSGRLRGFFIAPGGDDAFVSDYSASLSRMATSYSSTIYNASDTQLLWPIARLPVAASTFSK